MPRDTLGQQYHNLAAPLGAKISLQVYEIDYWRHPWPYLTAPSCATAPQLRTTALHTLYFSTPYQKKLVSSYNFYKIYTEGPYMLGLSFGGVYHFPALGNLTPFNLLLSVFFLFFSCHCESSDFNSQQCVDLIPAFKWQTCWQYFPVIPKPKSHESRDVQLSISTSQKSNPSRKRVNIVQSFSIYGLPPYNCPKISQCFHFEKLSQYLSNKIGIIKKNTKFQNFTPQNWFVD